VAPSRRIAIPFALSAALPGGQLERLPGVTARSGADAVGLAIGPAERWTLFVGSDGRIGGTWDAPAR
jgi:hypothetical protein